VLGAQASLIGALAAMACAAPGLGRADCALCYPAFNGDLAQVEVLLDRGADPNAIEKDRPPLSWALAAGHADVALLLLAHHASPATTIADSDYLTPLSWAAQRGDATLTAALLAAGAAVDGRTPSGQATPLIWAARRSAHSAGDLATIDLLLAAGADANAKDSNGWTPLACLSSYASGGASIGDVLPAIKTLLEAHAEASDPEAVRVALTLSGQGDRRLLTLLLAYGAQLDTVKDVAPLDAARGDPALMRAMVDAGADVEARGADGKSALDLAVERGDAASAEMLLSLGADCTDLTCSALQEAILSKNAALVAALLDHGADLTGMIADNEETSDTQFFSGDDADYPQGAIRVMVARFLVARHAVMTTASALATTHPEIGADIGGAKPPPGSVDAGLFARTMAEGAFVLGDPVYAYYGVLMAQGVSPPPPIPDEAKALAARGAALFEAARARSEMMAAAMALEAALRLAPWDLDAQHDACVVERLGGAAKLATSHCLFWVTYSPDGQSDADVTAFVKAAQAELK